MLQVPDGGRYSSRSQRCFAAVEEKIFLRAGGRRANRLREACFLRRFTLTPERLCSSHLRFGANLRAREGLRVSKGSAQTGQIDRDASDSSPRERVFCGSTFCGESSTSIWTFPRQRRGYWPIGPAADRSRSDRDRDVERCNGPGSQVASNGQERRRADTFDRAIVEGDWNIIGARDWTRDCEANPMHELLTLAAAAAVCLPGHTLHFPRTFARVGASILIAPLCLE
jgi:hypothetical protein